VNCRGSGRRRRPYSHRSPNSRNQGAHRQKYKAIQLILEEGLIRLTCPSSYRSDGSGPEWLDLPRP